MYFAAKQLRIDEAKHAQEQHTERNLPDEDVNEAIVENLQRAESEMQDHRTIRILAVCGSGQGSSMMMKMKIGSYLDKRGIKNIMDSCAVTDYKSRLANVDIIVCSNHLINEIEVNNGQFALGVKNMLNPATFGEELIALINKVSN